MKNFYLVHFLLILGSVVVWAQQKSIYFKEQDSGVLEIEKEAYSETINSDQSKSGEEYYFDPYWEGDEEKNPSLTGKLNQDLPNNLGSPDLFRDKESKDSIEGKKESSLAEAYYYVGEQYERQGKKTKGSSYKKRARSMNPNYIPSEKNLDTFIELSPRSLAEKESHLTIKRGTVRKGIGIGLSIQDEVITTRILRLQFDRFVRGILGENINVLDNLLAPVIQLNDQEFEKSDLMEGFKIVFSKSSLTNFTFKDLYVTESKNFSVSLEGRGGSVRVQAREREDLQELPFWKKNQEFYFTQENGKWFLTKIIAKN